MIIMTINFLQFYLNHHHRNQTVSSPSTLTSSHIQISSKALGWFFSPPGVPVASLSALGLRDLRSMGARLQVRCAAYRAGEEVRIALCSGATAELPMKDLEDPEWRALGEKG